MNSFISYLAIFLCISTVTVAWTTIQQPCRRSTRVSMSDLMDAAVPEVPIPAVPVTPIRKERINAKWFPFGLKAPLILDGSLPGDVGKLY